MHFFSGISQAIETKFTTPGSFFSVVFFTFLTIICSNSSNAGSLVLDISEVGGQNLPLKPHMSYFLDSNKSLSIEKVVEDITNDQLINWQPTNNYQAKPFRFTPTWFHLEIVNNGKKKKSLEFLCDEPMVNWVEYYVINTEGKVLNHYTSGALVPWQKKLSDHQFLSFPLEIEPHQSLQLVFLVKGRANIFLSRLQVVEAKYLKKIYKRNDFGMWFFLGNLVIYAIASLGLFYATKDKSYLMFCGYIVSAISLYFVRSGYFFMLLTPEQPLLQLYFEKLFMSSMFIFSFLFANQFLNLKERAPILYNINRGCSLLLSLYFIMFCIFGHHKIIFFTILMLLSGIFLQLINWLASAKLALKHIKNGLYYAISWSVYIYMMMFAGLNESGIINVALSTSDFVQIGIGLLSLLLFGALIINFKNFVEKEHSLRISDAAKSEFLSRMSHEVRTPLNGMLGMAQLVDGPNLTQEQKNNVEIIIKSGTLLLETLNNVLDYSKADAAKIVLEPKLVSIEEVCNEIFDIARTQAKTKGLEFSVAIDENLPENISLDPFYFRQVINNLLSNALKFTQQGFITINFSLDNQAKNLEVTVTDSGIGIKNSDTIFDAFSQGDNNTTRKYGGTGLGLTICKKIIILMKGKIWAEKRPEGGTLIGLSIPLNYC